MLNAEKFAEDRSPRPPPPGAAAHEGGDQNYLSCVIVQAENVCEAWFHQR